MTDTWFLVLIVAIVIDAGAHVVHEYRQGERDQRQREMEADLARMLKDVALILGVLKIWAVHWGEPTERVKTLLAEALREKEL